MPQAGLDYIRKLRDVKYFETIFDILAKQFEVPAKLDEARQDTLIQVVDPAVPPEKHSFPKRALIIAGSTAVGFLFALFVALFGAALERMRNDPEAKRKLHALRGAW